MWPFGLSKGLMSLNIIIYMFGLMGGSMAATPKSSLGVNWGVLNTHSLPPEISVQMLKDNGIGKVKLFIADEPILKALAGTGIEVMVAIPNGDLEAVCDYPIAKAWVLHNVTRYKPTSPSGVNIKYVAVGNEAFLAAYNGSYANLTFPALSNIQKALHEAGLGDKIKATVPLNADIYNSPSENPVPSSGRFRPDIKEQMVQILQLLQNNSAPFVINIYPFLNLYLNRATGYFPRDYAFFDGYNSPLVDKTTGFKYYNSFDAAYDGLVSAMAAEGFGNMTVFIGEIGWPTDGDVDANFALASRFYNGLMPKLAAKKGTPLRPGLDITVYLFELYDEDAKSIDPGTFERHWGLFTYDGKPKLPNITFISGSSGLVPARNVTYMQNKWCALKPEAASKDRKIIDEKVKFACERADCTAVTNGSSCSGLDANDKVSFAFNAYFQAMNQTDESCDFQGLGVVTTKNISTLNCKFIIQLALPHDDVPVPAPAPAPAHGAKGKHGQSDAIATNSQNTPTPSSAYRLMLLILQLPLLFF